jgi:hypothetical protein
LRTATLGAALLLATRAPAACFMVSAIVLRLGGEPAGWGCGRAWRCYKVAQVGCWEPIERSIGRGWENWTCGFVVSEDQPRRKGRADLIIDMY